jgi:hypothetical protein
MKEAIAIILRISGFLSFLVIGFEQLSASVDGLLHFFNITSNFGGLLVSFICIFFGTVPPFGTVLGIYGAHRAWGWTLFEAFGLFFILPISLICLFGAIEWSCKKLGIKVDDA